MQSVRNVLESLSAKLSDHFVSEPTCTGQAGSQEVASAWFHENNTSWLFVLVVRGILLKRLEISRDLRLLLMTILLSP